MGAVAPEVPAFSAWYNLPLFVTLTYLEYEVEVAHADAVVPSTAVAIGKSSAYVNLPHWSTVNLVALIV